MTGNKSFIVKKAPLPVSICSSSRPDLLGFHPNSHKMVYVETETAESTNEESFIAESSTIKLKSIQGEMKNNPVEACQQLLGGIEKEMGEMGCTYFDKNTADPIFELIEIYALTIYHDDSSCLARKFNINFSHCNVDIEYADKTILLSIE